MSVPLTNASLLAFINANPNNFPSSESPGGIANEMNNLQSTLAGPVPNDPITGAAFLACINGTDAGNFSVTLWTAIQTYASAGTVNIGSSDVQAAMDNLFANYTSTLNNLKALYTRLGTPAEVEFGTDTQITVDEVVAARGD